MTGFNVRTERLWP